MRLRNGAGLALFALLASTLPAHAAQVDDAAALRMGKARELIVAPDIPAARRDALLASVDAFYGFWNNGSPALLDRAIAPGFIDHTLPDGRPQGPAGPMAASRAFLAAVPDLKVAVVQQIVAGDRVVSHLNMSGHFTGRFQSGQGAGQRVNFIATDIVRVQRGRITDNWHLEDNLTFLRQIGAIAAPASVPAH